MNVACFYHSLTSSKLSMHMFMAKWHIYIYIFWTILNSNAEILFSAADGVICDSILLIANSSRPVKRQDLIEVYSWPCLIYTWFVILGI